MACLIIIAASGDAPALQQPQRVAYRQHQAKSVVCDSDIKHRCESGGSENCMAMAYQWRRHGGGSGGGRKQRQQWRLERKAAEKQHQHGEKRHQYLNGEACSMALRRKAAKSENSVAKEAYRKKASSVSAWRRMAKMAAATSSWRGHQRK